MRKSNLGVLPVLLLGAACAGDPAEKGDDDSIDAQARDVAATDARPIPAQDAAVGHDATTADSSQLDSSTDVDARPDSNAPETAVGNDATADATADSSQLESGTCRNGNTRSCAEDGYRGPCAVGVETCVDGVWGPCSIAPAPKDSCEPNNDANCDGVVNGGCLCVVGNTRSCAEDGKRGLCASGTETCQAGGQWSACSIGPTAKDGCALHDDANCNGIPNENCTCIAGQSRTCAEGGLHGKCASGTETCDSAGNWGPCSIQAALADACTSSGNDDNCNGIANEGCPHLQGRWVLTSTMGNNSCGTPVGSTRVFGATIAHQVGSAGFTITEGFTTPVNGTIDGSLISFVGTLATAGCVSGMLLDTDLTLNSTGNSATGSATFTCDRTGGTCTGVASLNADRELAPSDAGANDAPVGDSSHEDGSVVDGGGGGVDASAGSDGASGGGGGSAGSTGVDASAGGGGAGGAGGNAGASCAPVIVTIAPSDYAYRWSFDDTLVEESARNDFSIDTISSAGGSERYSCENKRQGASALYLDGSTALMSAYSYTGSGSGWTAAFWIYAEHAIADGAYSVYNASGFRFVINKSAQTMDIGWLVPTFTEHFTTGAWYHFTFTSDSSGSKIYVNGSLSHSSVASFPTAGWNRWLPGYKWMGYMDDFIVYDRSLNDMEAHSLYASYASGPGGMPDAGVPDTGTGDTGSLE